MRNTRQQFIDRALIRVLLRHPQQTAAASTLKQEADLMVQPPMTQHEFDEAMRNHDEQYRVAGVTTEYGTHWAITDTGRAWAAAHRV